MDASASFDERLHEYMERISPAEQRVAAFFRDNREEVLIASASALAEQAGTSDATVVRTAKALGFSGMDELRRTLVQELRENLSPASRMIKTLNEMGDDLEAAFYKTLDVHQQSLDGLRRDIAPEAFRRAVNVITHAKRVFIFGLGPSSAMAIYFKVQLGRFGINAHALTQTGLLLADELQRLRAGDALLIFAYGRVYAELSALLDQADRFGITKVLISDTLGTTLRSRVDLGLPVARGRADMLSMHTVTLALIEALLVGVAVERPRETVASLESLNTIRAALAGNAMGLPTTRIEP